MKAVKEIFWVQRAVKEGKQDEWHRCGVVFQRDSGSLALKLDTMPVTFDGWLEILPIKKKDEFIG